MTFKDFLKTTLVRSCIYFTLVMVLYIAACAIVNVADDDLLLDAGRTILFYVFALLTSLAGSLFSLQKLSSGLRLVLHYLICIFAFYACFMLPVSMRASGVIIGLVIFTVLYFAVFGIVALFKSRYRRNAEQLASYQKQFKKQK